MSNPAPQTWQVLGLDALGVVGSVLLLLRISNKAKGVWGEKITGGSPAWSWRVAAGTQTVLGLLTLRTAQQFHGAEWSDGTKNASGAVDWLRTKWDIYGTAHAHERLFHWFFLGYLVKDCLPGVCEMQAAMWLHHGLCGTLIALSLLQVLDVGHNACQAGATLLEMGSLALALAQCFPESILMNHASMVVMTASNALALWLTYFFVEDPAFANIGVIQFVYAVAIAALVCARQAASFQNYKANAAVHAEDYSGGKPKGA